MTAQLLILVVGTGAEPVAAEIREALPRTVEVAQAPDAAAALDVVNSRDAIVPLITLIAGEADVDRALTGLFSDDQMQDTRSIVLTSRAFHDDVADAIDQGRLHTLVMQPAPPGLLGWMVVSQLARWMVDHGMEPVEPVPMPGGPRETSELLHLLEASNEELTARIVSGIDHALTRRPRLRLPAGVRLTRQGEYVDGVYIVISGKVALTRKTPSENLLLHHASTGPVVGLVSLARQERAFFTSTTTTDVEAIHVSTDQLDRALRLDPGVAEGLAAGAIRGFTLRLLRSEELQVERNELNVKLKKEQKRLAKALAQLEAARLELVSQARFATLGELAAGVAHELNNPVAALQGAAANLSDHLATLVRSHPDAAILSGVLAGTLDRPSLSTAEERRIRREIERVTGDPEAAFRLVSAGVVDPAVASRVDRSTLGIVEAAAMLGTAARSIDVATTRITDLVNSLRSYARPETEVLDDVDVNAGIEDTLHLVAHRLRGIEVVRDYGDIPRIRAHPSRLGQVWTNLIVNAADALAGQGRLEILTHADGPHVVVDVIDNGPGVDPDVLPRIFEPRFTTKHGTIRYGLGLGLSLASRIVEEAGGTITVDSVPGRTAFTVTLPVAGPPKEDS